MSEIVAKDSDFIVAGTSRVIADSTDNELVERLQAGDDSAFEEIFNRHRRRVASIASRFFRQPDQIEEILQNTFTKAYFSIGDFSNKHDASFAAWLSRIAFNASYDELRRNKRQPAELFSEISEDEAKFLNESLSNETTENKIEDNAVFRDLAGKLISRLSPEDRMILVMLDVEEMSVAEIAQTTDWSISKIKVRAHRARAALRKIVKRFL